MRIPAKGIGGGCGCFTAENFGGTTGFPAPTLFHGGLVERLKTPGLNPGGPMRVRPFKSDSLLHLI